MVVDSMPYLLYLMTRVVSFLSVPSTLRMIGAQQQQQECPPIDGSCVYQANYDVCVFLVNAGCTDIRMSESCPVDFSCRRPWCPPIDGDCMREEQYRRCTELVNAGCTEIGLFESCPFLVSCNAPTSLNRCPAIDGSCVFQEQYDECVKLATAGCTDISTGELGMEPCPVQFSCLTPRGPCPPIDGNCVFKEQYDECTALDYSGCSTIEMTSSCPVQFICTSIKKDTFFDQLFASMRLIIDFFIQSIFG